MSSMLFNDDCMKILKDIPDASVDCICADLPYGQTRNKWDTIIPLEDYVIVNKHQLSKDEFLLYCYKTGQLDYRKALKHFNDNKKNGLWTEYKRIIKDNGAIILFANGMFTEKLMKSNEKMWRYNLIWEKTQPTGFLNANRMPLRSHEDICIFYKKQTTYNPQKTNGHVRKVSTAEHKRNSKQSTNYNQVKNHSYDSTERFPKSIWKYPKDTQKSALTPTQKPLALLEELIKTYTNPGDLVLDNTMGSGTTGIACKKLNRDFIGIEQDFECYQIAQQRIGGDDNE